MQSYRLALIGFGNVGQGLAEILKEHGDDLARRFGARFQIVAVSDLLKGSLYEPRGLDPAELLAAVRNNGTLEGISAAQHGWDALTTIVKSDADVIVELSYTDLKTGQPALDHLRAALQNGRHVVTTNKGPIALYYQELMDMAQEKQVQLGVEGTVMSGTPALFNGRELLAGAGIRRIQGILNGTTNYILTQMEAGASYEAALKDAQARGYAEADPSGDVEGYDAAGKAVIVANMLMGGNLRMTDVTREGITALTPEALVSAAEAGERWKLIALIEQEGPDVKASVRPQRLPLAHPLAGVGGATNAITFTTDLLGEVTLIGPGAGRLETGYAIIGDLLAIHQRNQ